MPSRSRREGARQQGLVTIEVNVVITLSGKQGLIIGIANEHSLAHGCARHFRAAGAELAITYLNAKSEPYVRPLAEALQSDIA